MTLTKLTFVVDVTVGHDTEFPAELVRETIRYHLSLLPAVTTLGVSLDGDLDPNRRVSDAPDVTDSQGVITGWPGKTRPMTDQPILTSDPYTVASCFNCGFRQDTSQGERDRVKAETHEHIRATGHRVKFMDDVILGLDTPRSERG